MNEPILTEERIAFLEALRDSGVTNMFGATPYLVEEFHLTQEVACDILCQWMESFTETKQEMPETRNNGTAKTVKTIHRLLSPDGTHMVTFHKHDHVHTTIRHYNATDHNAPVIGWKRIHDPDGSEYPRGSWPVAHARNVWGELIKRGYSINSNANSTCITQDELDDTLQQAKENSNYALNA